MDDFMKNARRASNLDLTLAENSKLNSSKDLDNSKKKIFKTVKTNVEKDAI